VAAVLVHIDLDGDKPHPSSLVALAAGRQLASSWGATLYAAVIKHDASGGVGHDSTAQVASGTALPGVDSIEAQVTRFGADKLVVAVTEAQVAPLWALVGNAWQGVIDHLRPRVVLFGASSPSAHELGPRTGARIGARLLTRARTVGGDEIELRDRDGALVRIGDSGAAVALIGRAETLPEHANNDTDDIDVVALSVPSEIDVNLELAGTEPAKSGTMRSVLIALGDELADNSKAVADATQLAAKLDGQLVIGKGGKKVPGAISVDAAVPLAPDLCIAVGKVTLDIAGASSLIRIGGPSDKTVDGVLPAPADVSLASLVKNLEDA
jgi:electron transfer flavoprotein alpha subunit